MQKDRYIVIHEWMLDLGLDSAEVMALALIWGTCRTCGTFRGGLKEVAKWTALSQRQARRLTKLLKDAGILTIKGGHQPSYFIPEGIQANTTSIRPTVAQLKVQMLATLKRPTTATLIRPTMAAFYKGNIGGNTMGNKEEKEESMLTMQEKIARIIAQQDRENDMEAKRHARS